MNHTLSISGKNGEKIALAVTDFIGLNYSGDFDLKCSLSISSGNYRVETPNYFCLDVDLFAFCDALSECYEAMSGSAVFQPKKDTCLSFKVTFMNGVARVQGSFQERYDIQNVLVFEFEADASSLFSLMHEIGALKRSLSRLE